jgi:SAM-dependent methyltransferase
VGAADVWGVAGAVPQVSDNNMNWKYVSAGIVRRYLPEQMLFAIMKLRGDGSMAENASDAYLTTWQTKLAARHWNFAGKHVLEVGSGRYARFGLQMLAAGAEHITLVDFYALPLNEPAHRAMLEQDCERLGLDYRDACSRINLIRGDITTLTLPAAEKRADIVISHAVLEHVRDPQAILSCCWEWLKPGGITHHFVDLRDHNFRFRYPFEMLTFSDPTWNRWLDLRGGFHLNRWRVSDYLAAANKAGFINVEYEPLLTDRAGLKNILPRLHEQFRHVQADLLAVLCIYLYGEKSHISNEPE